MRAGIAIGAAGAAMLGGAVLLSPAAAAACWRAGVVSASAPAIGAVLLLAIARLTGAAWRAVAGPARMLPWLAPALALLGVAQLATPAPPHLALWLHPLAVGARALLAAGALAWAGRRLATGAGATFAGVTLALYAWLVTPIAGDWLLGQVPGHAVSAVGMMLAVEQILGATAWALASGCGGERLRRDMAALMIAAGLGLFYLAFMDYLIVWFGNLPARVGFYLDRRGAWAMATIALAFAAVLPGPIALLTLGRGERTRRAAGGAALAGLALFDLWWVGGGPIAAVAGIGTLGLIGGLTSVVWRAGEPA